MPSVKVDNNFDKALRKFKKKVINDGILEEVRRRTYYEKPTTKRNRKKAAAIARHRKRAMREKAKASGK